MRTDTTFGAKRIAKRVQRGFTLVELLIATLVLLVGIVAVMELVPRAMRANLNNRMNTTSTVIAQRLTDLIMNAGVGANTLVDASGTFPCGVIAPCSLGVPGGAVGTYQFGAPLLAGGQVDYAAGPVPGFRLIYQDPNDATGGAYDVRWAVIASVEAVGPAGPVVVSKRYVVGVQRTDGIDAVTLTSWATR